MTYAELKAIRNEILRLRSKAPANKGARGISRSVMRAIADEREDMAAYIGISIYDLRRIDDWPISERHAERMKEALARAYKEIEKRT